MTSRSRTRRSAALLTAVALTLAGVVWVAAHANGRPGSTAYSNDGGAWLTNRSAGAVGHLNRAVLEVTAAVKVAEPGANLDVDQSGDLVVVHDKSSARAILLDPRLGQVSGELLVPAGVEVRAAPNTVVIARNDPLTVWTLTRDEALSTADLEDVDPDFAAEEVGLVSVGPDRTSIYRPSTAELVELPHGQPAAHADNETATASPPTISSQFGPAPAEGSPPPARLTSVATATGSVTVLATDTQLLTSGSPSASPIPLSGPVTLQQPSAAPTAVAYIDRDGRIGLADLATRSTIDTGVELAGAEPVAPIYHDDCVFALTLEPPVFTRTCNHGDGWTAAEHTPLEQAGPNLRLRLVNGWVWINDVDNGVSWTADAQAPLARVDDWGAALADDADNEGDATLERAGGIEELRLDPDAADAELRNADEQDEDGENDLPVARDDEAQTRVDRPVLVRVLDNDEDPDGDVLLVDEVTLLGDTLAVAQVSPTRDSVQLTPPPGYVGTVRFGYHITDGRGGAAQAVATVTITAPTQDDNRPPEPVTDIVAVRRGAPVSLNVLANDRDPDGDSLTLLDASDEAGTTIFDASGRVTYTPDPAESAQGEIVLTYLVADDFGATAEGRLRVRLRLAEANTPPDARHDAAVTSVGKPVRVNLLDNDTDPDSDELIVARQPILVRGPDGVPAQPAAGELARSTSDGDVTFVPTEPGTYVFSYVVSDGQGSDSAQLRVDVGEADANEPPIAIRDDVTIARGSSRVVYVLDNDADPNGDVVGIVEWSDAAGIDIEELPGIGFRVAVHADAPDRVVFRYAISDGHAESDGSGDSVATVVVISVVDAAVTNQPPVATRDRVEARPGRSTTIRVLDNDYDPEGGSLRILRTAAPPGLGAEASVAADGQSIELSLISNDTTSSAATPEGSEPDAAERAPRLPTRLTLSYDVEDEQGATTGTTVEVRIIQPSEPNRPPVARLDTGRTTIGRELRLAPLSNDRDPDGDRLTIESLASQPSHGRATLTNDATIVYQPDRSFTGSDRFEYVVIDTEGARSIGQIQVGVLEPLGRNRPPSANDDTIAVPIPAGQRSAAPVALDVLANDFDPDGDPLTIIDHTAVTRGELELVDNQLWYRPPTEASEAPTTSREVSFTYSISDGRGTSDDGLVRLRLDPAPEPVAPEAIIDQVGPIRGNQTVTVDVAANDLDPDGDPATLVVTSTDPDVTVEANQVTIAVGTASSQHSYTITDRDGLTAEGTVTVFVVENEAPTVASPVVTTPFEQPITLDLATDASDPDNDALFFSCCDQVQGGVADVLGAGNGELRVRFTPSPGFSGDAGLAFQVDDQAGHLVTGRATITVLPAENQPPEAVDGHLELEAGTAAPFNLAALATDPDPDDSLRFEIVQAASTLIAELDESTLQVEAAVNQAGSSDQIVFAATDEAGHQVQFTVTVTVTPVTAPLPQAVADQSRTYESTPVTISVLDNDVDPLGDGLTITSPGSSTDGTVTQEAGVLVFVPANGFSGTTTFNYTMRDAADDPDRESVGIVTVEVIGRPASPAPPLASADNATATLTWAAPIDNGARIDRYRLEFESTSGETGVIDIAEAANSRTVTDLTNGEEYKFRLQAHNEAGWGEWGQWSTPVRPDTRPDAPAPPQVTFADQALDVDWTPPTNDGSPITGYLLEIGGGTNEIVSLGVVGQHQWRNLSNGVEYQFRVAAENAAGVSDWSAWSTSEHPLGPPEPPVAPVAGRGDRYLDVDWQAPDNNGDPIDAYELEIRSSGQRVAVTGSTTTTYRWSDLTNGTSEQFRVRASNRDPAPGSWSDWSNAVKPCAKPEPPATPSVVRGDTQATVTWSAPDAQGCSITGYRVLATGSDGSKIQQTAGAGATSHQFTGLTNGVSYQFEVRARNEEGLGSWSAKSASITPAGPPGVPSFTTARAVAKGTVQLEWTAAAPNGTPVTRYPIRLFRSTATEVSTTSHQFDQLLDNTDYRFQVQACNAVACSNWSDPVTVTTWGPPTAPRNVSASAGDATWTLSWSTPSSDGGSPIASHQYRVNGWAREIVSPTIFSYSLPNAVNGTTYTGEVRACNKVGCGPWASATATPAQPPPTITASVGTAYNDPNTCGGTCHWVHGVASGLPPNTAVDVVCWSSKSGNAFKTVRYTSSPSGTLDVGPCYYGLSGYVVWLSIDGVESNRLRWP